MSNDNHKFEKIVAFIKRLYPNKEYIPLHEPRFIGAEKEYLIDCIDSGFVSSVGEYVNRFEQKITEYTGAKHAVATVNGTAALHVALILAGLKNGDEVITQAVTFIATANAISYCDAKPVFLDSDRETLGLSPEALEQFLNKNCIIKDDGFTYNKKTNNRISACVPMHVFGHPVKIEEICQICGRNNIPVVEDAAESIGSFYKERHTGTFGCMGILSFNGNKTITTGGGGMIITNNEELLKKAKHITTTARISHPWEIMHDKIAFNYRMPNINATLGCAQLEKLPEHIENKRKIAKQYKEFFSSIDIHFVDESSFTRSNYWLNAIIFNGIEERNAFLEYSNNNGVMTRPIWRLMPDLDMYKNCQTDELLNAKWLADRVVNIPSSVII